ncbi:MAG: hypothetical protein V4666_02660 [Bacteroidota bacterium]
MSEEKLQQLIEYLDFVQIIDLDQIYNHVLNEVISFNEATQFLYGLKINHENRFRLFICLHEASLKNNLKVAIQVFREAYCASNNIYDQIKTSSYSFNLKNFINTNKLYGIDFKSIMNDDEIEYYNDLGDTITIYRGMCDQEYQSKNFGISWTIDENEAKNYVYFDKNKVKDGDGGVVNICIEKKNIAAVFSVHGKKEIIYIN